MCSSLSTDVRVTPLGTVAKCTPSCGRVVAQKALHSTPSAWIGVHDPRHGRRRGHTFTSSWCSPISPTSDSLCWTACFTNSESVIPGGGLGRRQCGRKCHRGRRLQASGLGSAVRWRLVRGRGETDPGAVPIHPGGRTLADPVRHSQARDGVRKRRITQAKEGGLERGRPSERTHRLTRAGLSEVPGGPKQFCIPPPRWDFHPGSLLGNGPLCSSPTWGPASNPGAEPYMHPTVKWAPGGCIVGVGCGPSGPHRLCFWRRATAYLTRANRRAGSGT